MTQIIGFVGVFLILGAFFLVQFGFISSQQRRFPCLNLLGSLMVLFSLLGSQQYAAMALELAWAIISVAGLITTTRSRKRLTLG